MINEIKMKKLDKNKDTTISFRTSKLVKKEIENLCNEKGVRMSHLIDEIIQNYLEMQDEQLVTIQAPAGSLVIPPHKIKPTFKKMFDAGQLAFSQWASLGKDEKKHFENELDKIIKSFDDITFNSKSKWAQGGDDELMIKESTAIQSLRKDLGNLASIVTDMLIKQKQYFGENYVQYMNSALMDIRHRYKP